MADERATGAGELPVRVILKTRPRGDKRNRSRREPDEIARLTGDDAGDVSGAQHPADVEGPGRQVDRVLYQSQRAAGMRKQELIFALLQAQILVGDEQFLLDRADHRIAVDHRGRQQHFRHGDIFVAQWDQIRFAVRSDKTRITSDAGVSGVLPRHQDAS